MDISPIKTQRDYRKVLKEIEGLMNAKRRSVRDALGCVALGSGLIGGLIFVWGDEISSVVW